MDPEEKPIVSNRHGTVIDPHGMIPDIPGKELLDQIIELLRKLGIPDTVFQTGFLTDVEDPEGKNPKRYIFTNSFLLEKDDPVFYSPLKPDNIFKVVITGKR